MSFILIKGTFHLVGRNKKGKPTGFEPDGDSIHFKPKNPKLLDRLRQVGRPYKLTKIRSVQLRFQGIDALELHYIPKVKGARVTHQPRPLADQAREFLTGELGLNPVPYTPPRNVRVKPPVPRDATPGYILAESLEAKGRPVSFAFTGTSSFSDGKLVPLTKVRLKNSLNFRLVKERHAYPLFYGELEKRLRQTLANAAKQASDSDWNLWKENRTLKGLQVTGLTDLEEHGVIFPKLFRRLAEFFSIPGSKLKDFPAWLAAEHREEVLDLKAVNPTTFDKIVKVTGNTIKLTRSPVDIVFVSEK